MTSKFKPTRWYRVLQADGKLWCETSDYAEACREAWRINSKVQRLFQKVTTKYDWRDIT